MSLNSGFDYVERVGRDGAGRTVLDHLSRRYRHSSSAEWSARIEDGTVRLDGRRVEVSTLLAAGQRLEWSRPPWEEPEAPLGFAILYRDADVLGVAKPAGLPTLPGGGFLERTLLHRVRALFPGASPLHRLGRHTSGLVLFARAPEAHAALSAAFARREVRKRYRALAAGDPPATETFDIHTPIGRVPHALLGEVHAAAEAGKPAHSRVVVVERREGAFLCDVWIWTGRPHQIRIHLAACGHPLVGDPLYLAGGHPAADSTALPGDPGYRLHAAELAFVHPPHRVRDGLVLSASGGAAPALSMITEPATTLTDYAMAALAVCFAVDLRRRGSAGPHARSWSTAFSLLAASALAGGTFHGFQTSLAPWVADALWRASLATAALSSFATLRALALQWLGEARARPWTRLGVVKLAAALLAGAVHPEFVVVVADFGTTLAFGLAAASLARSRDSRALGLLRAGIALFVLGAVIQQARVSPHPAFNHNDLFHVIQILGNVSLFLSAREDETPIEG